MTNKKQILDFAFEDAVQTTHINNMDANLVVDYIKTAMFGYAEHNGYEFTEEEVMATIVAGLESLKKSGKDFTIQTWTMK